MEKRVSEKKLAPNIPDDLLVFAEAISGHHRVSNRLWLISATVTLIVISSSPTDGEVIKLLGFSLNADQFFPIAAVLLAFTNIAYCSSYMQAMRTLEIVRDRLKSTNINAEYYTNKFTIADAIHGIYMPSLKRVVPIARSMPRILDAISFSVLRFSSDLIFFGLPIAGLVFAFLKSDLSNFYASIFAILAFISIGTSLSLQIRSLVAFRWELSQFKVDQEGARARNSR